MRRGLEDTNPEQHRALSGRRCLETALKVPAPYERHLRLVTYAYGRTDGLCLNATLGRCAATVGAGGEALTTTELGGSEKLVQFPPLRELFLKTQSNKLMQHYSIMCCCAMDPQKSFISLRCFLRHH